MRLLRNNRCKKGKATKGLGDDFLAIPTSREKQAHKCFCQSDADVAARPSLGKAQMDSRLDKKTTGRAFGEEKQSLIFCGCHPLIKTWGRGAPGLPQASASPSMSKAARAALSQRALLGGGRGQGAWAGCDGTWPSALSCHSCCGLRGPSMGHNSILTQPALLQRLAL